MVLDKIPGTQVFTQRDVRETPAATATASAVGLTDGKYLVVDYHADMTDERKITAGEGIDFNDAGADSTFTILGEDSGAANKGIVIITGSTGINVSYASGTATLTTTDGEIDHDSLANTHNMTTDIDARITAGEGIDYSAGTISGENATTTNKGIASFNTNDFTVSSGAVSLKNKTSYWSCKGAAFQPTNQVYDFNMVATNFNYLESDSDNQNFVVSVNLPNGAVVTSCVVYGSDTGDTWTLYRGAINASDSSAMATAAVDTTDSSISDATIDNSTYGYWLVVADTDNGAQLHGAGITYTTDYD